MRVAKLSIALVACALSGCVAAPRPPFIEIPLSAGWYEGRQVYYITTDITDPPMAGNSRINLATRLRDAIPPDPKDPTVRDVLERVYKFPKGEQDAVFASIPQPLGAQSRDAQYSPLWLLYTVQWRPEAPVRILTSQDDILQAEEQNQVSVTRTEIVINCPIVATQKEGALPGTFIRW